VPAVTTAASGKLFRKGLLIKDGTALERLAEVDEGVFDKTGTLTKGKPKLIGHAADPSALAVARALAQASAHPLAQALVRDTSGTIAAVEDVREVPGHGVEGHWNGQPVRLGRADWVGAESATETATWLRVGAQTPVAFRFADALREGAQEAVEALKAQGIVVTLLSGDSPSAVAHVAQTLGITDWQAECLPQDKVAHIAARTAQGARVLMVGDGLNDTAALAAAHVSISPATALDAARVASDMVLLGTDLSPIASALQTAQQATRRIRENFTISTVYNVVAVPLAIVGLATPLIAALAMSLSSITVTLNSLRLK
jgi:Cu2+-exporting ATPase